MPKPYVVLQGDIKCKHDNTVHYVITVAPPIDEWRCESCGRIVRQNREAIKPYSEMPEVEETIYG